MPQLLPPRGDVLLAFKERFYAGPSAYVLEEYFLHYVFEMAATDYPEKMDLEFFTEALEEFRVAMNDLGQLGFKPLSQDSVLKIFKAYKARAPRPTR